MAKRSDKERSFDAWLAASARVGDRASLGRLVERWHGKLLAHAWRLTGDSELAADVVQDAWADVIGGIGRLDDATAFPAWAYQIVTRRCARAIGKLQRGRAGRAALGREPQDSSGQPDPPEMTVEMATMRSLMAELPSEQRAALALFYLEGLRVAEVAVAMNVPPGTIKTRLMHARNKLRARLQGDDHEHD